MEAADVEEEIEPAAHSLRRQLGDIRLDHIRGDTVFSDPPPRRGGTAKTGHPATQPALLTWLSRVGRETPLPLPYPQIRRIRRIRTRRVTVKSLPHIAIRPPPPALSRTGGLTRLDPVR